MAHFIANAFNAIAFYQDLRLFRMRIKTFCPFFLFKSRHKILTIKFVYIKVFFSFFFPLTTVDCFQLFSVILMIDFEFAFLFTREKITALFVLYFVRDASVLLIEVDN